MFEERHNLQNSVIALHGLTLRNDTSYKTHVGRIGLYDAKKLVEKTAKIASEHHKNSA